MFTSTSEQRRKFTCPVCGVKRIITTKPIEKSVVVCAHQDTRGGILPILLLREEGELILD